MNLVRVHPTLVRVIVAGTAATSVPAPRAIGAQELGWSGTTEASANVIFGAARGRLAAFAAGVSRADSVLEVRSDVVFGYADARGTDDSRNRVTARHWRASLGFDRHPFATLSPFAFGSVEASLQQRIRDRVAGGAGAKVTLHRDGDDDVSASLALLWERTRALDPRPDLAEVTTRTRWSLRVRVRRKLTTTLHLSHVTFYQPSTDALGRYTATSNTSLARTVNERLSLTVTLRDQYDSEAERRGARSNHDGQLLFGARASF
jgi:hypothetical protein